MIFEILLRIIVFLLSCIEISMGVYMFIKCVKSLFESGKECLWLFVCSLFVLLLSSGVFSVAMFYVFIY